MLSDGSTRYIIGIIRNIHKGDFGGVLEKTVRKPNRLREYSYSQDGIYFITICTQNREHVLSEIVITGVGDGFPVPLRYPSI